MGKTVFLFNCKHYRRSCQVKCTKCEKFYMCRLCHDEVHYHNESDPKKNHQMDRFCVKKIKCSICKTIQKPGPKCTECNIEFAEYFCGTCNLWDDDVEKKPYHCQKCGICRTGGFENSYHCDKCERCISKTTIDTHRCISIKYNCPVCLEDMQDSVLGSTFMRCGHAMHVKCF